jgi:hypothetical protein
MQRFYEQSFRRSATSTKKWNTSINVPQSHPILGQLVNRIRTGNTADPPQYKAELREMSFFGALGIWHGTLQECLDGLLRR